MSAISEMTTASAIPAIDGAGLSCQPQPKALKKKKKAPRSAIESLIDEAETAIEPIGGADLEDEGTELLEPAKDDKAQPKERHFDISKTVSVIRDGVGSEPSEVLALEVDPEYARWRVNDNNRTWTPARVASNEEARKLIGSLISYEDEDAAGRGVDESKKPAQATPVTEASLRDFFRPVDPGKPLPTSLPKLDESAVNQVVATIVPPETKPGSPAAVSLDTAAGFGESLMRGGPVPPPDVSAPSRLVEAVHRYIAPA